MSFTTTFLIAIGLSMDAFAVSVANGVSMKTLRVRHAFMIAFFFGAFQALMPVIGWLAGLRVADFIEQYDHWIAFVLLSIIGGKMIYESFRIKEAEEDPCSLNIGALLVLSIATSIDALAVGLSFAFLKTAILAPVVIIGAVTFVLSFLGVVIGEKIGHLFESKIEFLGGVILIGIGGKILLEHLGYL